MTITAYRTVNPNLWEATAMWKDNGCLRMVNGEGPTEADARANLQIRLQGYLRSYPPAAMPVAPAYKTRAFLILIAAIFSPSLCMAQPAGGPVIDRIEARVEQLRESLHPFLKGR